MTRPQRTPTEIGPYQIERELARGGMGIVYLARDPRLDRAVAIKVLPDDYADDEDLMARFHREARILASLNHPNIASIYALEEKEGRHYLILELVTGKTLKEMLAAGPLTLADTLSICSQIARAVEAAHERGIVHRDLKPANVKITPEGVVKVLDFGVAKNAPTSGDHDDNIDLTAAGMLGTPGYMSPEQIQGQTVNRRADIWAFGCLLYECVVGAMLFDGQTAYQRIKATIETEPNWSRLPTPTPTRMRTLLRRCLEKDPERRLVDIGDAALELDDAQATLEDSQPDITPQAAVRHNLPRSLTSFVGRERQLDELATLLDSARLITLTGVGGCGKTRLALELAARRAPREAHGAWMIELAPLTDASLIWQSIAACLNVREEPDRPLAATVPAALHARQLLIVLDNCEHLLEACAQVAEALLPTCPGLRILTTSREALGVAGENNYPVPPLEVPDSEHLPVPEIAQSEAVRLFTERALLARPGFAVTDANAAIVAAICRSVDGIPLAIELAAAWVKVLSVDEIATRLDDRFRLLRSGSRSIPRRHQTLRATIDWSYEHLPRPEQTLLGRLSMFAGGWTLDAAEAVCSGDPIADDAVLELLTHLVDTSLVVVDREEGRRRYRLLETVRQYARERLDDQVEAGLRLRHVEFFITLGEAAALELPGPEQADWLDRLEAEHENYRAALEWCRSRDDQADNGLRLTNALWRFWDRRGYWSEGRSQLTAVLERAPAEPPSRLRAEALHGAGSLAYRQGDNESSRVACTESLEISRKLDDTAGIARSLEQLGNVALEQGELSEARRLYEDSLARRREADDKHGIARSLNSLSLVADAQEDYGQARALLEESLGLFREQGDRWGIAVGLNNLGLIAKRQRDYETARSLCSEALTISRELGNRAAEAINLENLSEVVERLGDLASARSLREQSLSMFHALGDKLGVARSLVGFAVLAVSQNDTERAARLFGAAEALRTAIGLQLGPADIGELEPCVAAARDALGDESFETAAAAGAGLGLDRAVRYALGDDDDHPTSPSEPGATSTWTTRPPRGPRYKPTT